MKKLAVLCLAIPIISLLFIGCNSHENNNDPISDKETGNIISDSLPDGFIVEEKHGLYIVKGVRTAIVTQHYFGIFEQDELLDLYAELEKEKRQLLKKYLVI